MPGKDAPVINAMKELSGKYPRFGSRRIRIFLGRSGIEIGKERCSRLWAKAGLQIPKKRRRRATGTRQRPLAPAAINSVCNYEFVHDACTNGQKIKCLTVVDEFTRECPAIDVAGSFRSTRVIDVLSRLMRVHGVPRYLRSDIDPEFVSKKLLAWVADASLEIAPYRSGKTPAEWNQ